MKVELRLNSVEIRAKLHFTCYIKEIDKKVKAYFKIGEFCLKFFEKTILQVDFCVSLYAVANKTLCYEMGFRLKFSRETQFVKTCTKIAILG